MTEEFATGTGRPDDAGFRQPSQAFLRYCAWSILAAATAAASTILLTMADQPWRVSGPALMALVALAALRLLSAGRQRAAQTVLVWGSWVAVTGVSTFFGGLRALLVVAYPLLILMGGWLLGLRAAAVLASLTVLAIVGFVVGDAWAWLPTPPSTPAMMHGLVQGACSVVALLLIVFLVRSYQNRIDDVRRLASDLAQRTAELQAREADLNRAQAVAKVGSWVYDLVSGRIDMSAETCRILGLPTGTVGSLDAFMARVHPDDRDTTALTDEWRDRLFGETGTLVGLLPGGSSAA